MAEQRPSTLHIAAVLGAGVVAISWASMFVRWCTLPPLAIAAWRLILATALVLCAARPSLPPSQRQAWQGALSGVCLAAHFATWISSLSYLPVSVSVVLVTTSPIFTALFARLTLGETLRQSQLLGVVVAALGSTGMTPLSGLKGGPEAGTGCLLALSGAISVAAYFVLGKNCCQDGRWNWKNYLQWVYGWAALTLVAACLVQGVPLWGYSAENWQWLLLLGLVPQGIGHSALNWALRFAGSAQVSVTVLGEPIGASLLAWGFLGEAVGAREAFFGALILTGVTLVLWTPTEAKR